MIERGSGNQYINLEEEKNWSSIFSTATHSTDPIKTGRRIPFHPFIMCAPVTKRIARVTRVTTSDFLLLPPSSPSKRVAGFLVFPLINYINCFVLPQ